MVSGTREIVLLAAEYVPMRDLDNLFSCSNQTNLLNTYEVLAMLVLCIAPSNSRSKRPML